MAPWKALLSLAKRYSYYCIPESLTKVNVNPVSDANDNREMRPHYLRVGFKQDTDSELSVWNEDYLVVLRTNGDLPAVKN